MKTARYYNGLSIIKLVFAIILLIVFPFIIDEFEVADEIKKLFPALAFFLASYIIISFLKLIYRIKNKISIRESDNVVAGLNNIFRILIFLSLVFGVLAYLEIGVIHFITSISIVAAAIAIISKEYLTAIISGFILSFTKIIDIGDFVLFNENKGQIIDITLTKIYLENDQGELIIINNDKAFFSNIINYSKSNKRRVHLKFEIAPDDFESIDEFEADLFEQLEEFDQYIEEDTINLKVEEIKIDRIEFTMNYTLTKLERDIEKRVRRKTVRKIVNHIQSNLKNNIE